MSCLEVRDRLPEHTLGVLDAQQSAEVERHLEWCVACSKESVELQEGVETVGSALPPLDPPGRLGSQIAAAVTGTLSGTGRQRSSRRAVKLLVAATLAAVLAAVGAMGWAVAERRRADTITVTARKRLNNVQELKELIAGLGGRTFESHLIPSSGFTGLGEALIVASPHATNWILVDILPPLPARGPDTGPYEVQVVDRSGRVQSFGQLDTSRSGDLILVQNSTKDLSRAITVSILDSHSMTVLTGRVEPYAGG